MITRLLKFAAYVFSFFTLVAAGGLPTSNSGGTSSSSGSSSNSYSGGTSNSISNPLNTLELKNGLNMVQSLVYGKKYEKVSFMRVATLSFCFTSSFMIAWVELILKLKDISFLEDKNFFSF